MHVLVTGGAGYVGSVCSAVLLESGHDVSIIDDFSTGNRDAVPAEAHLIEGELSKIIDQVLAEKSFDAVVHCAARSLVGESVSNPELYWHANVVTTLRLLDAMRAHQVSNLVFPPRLQPTANPSRCRLRNPRLLNPPTLTAPAN